MSYQILHPMVRKALGAIGAVTATTAMAMLFGPFSDLSTAQLAAGPHATTGADAVAPIVMANTGRHWGAAASAPVPTRVAVR